MVGYIGQLPAKVSLNSRLEIQRVVHPSTTLFKPKYVLRSVTEEFVIDDFFDYTLGQRIFPISTALG